MSYTSLRGWGVGVLVGSYEGDGQRRIGLYGRRRWKVHMEEGIRDVRAVALSVESREGKRRSAWAVPIEHGSLV